MKHDLSNASLPNRKSIHEIDCLAMDVVLATCFDWRELANRLSSVGKKVPTTNCRTLTLPQAVYRMAHAVCHGDPGFAEGITKLLDWQYRNQIKEIGVMDLSVLCQYAHGNGLASPNLQGSLWALVTDPREGAEKISRVFIQTSVTWLFSSVFQSSSNHLEFSRLIGRNHETK